MNNKRIRNTALGVLGVIIVATTSRLAVAGNSAPQEPAEINVAAPELVGGPWLNTPNNKPITLASRKGKVTVVEFWTFG